MRSSKQGGLSSVCRYYRCARPHLAQRGQQQELRGHVLKPLPPLGLLRSTDELLCGCGCGVGAHRALKGAQQPTLDDAAKLHPA